MSQIVVSLCLNVVISLAGLPLISPQETQHVQVPLAQHWTVAQLILTALPNLIVMRVTTIIQISHSVITELAVTKTVVSLFRSALLISFVVQINM